MNVSVPEDVRLEIKFVAPETELGRVLAWIRLHPAGFALAYPDRQVNNVYLDSWDFGSYADNLAGVSHRIKLRHRWYGGSAGPAAGVLELKCKRNAYGWKERFDVPEPPWTAGDDWRTVQRRLIAQLPPRGRLLAESFPAPALLNRYQRRYFLSRDGRLRVTVDWGQVAYDQRLRPRPELRRKLNLPAALVVEAKFAREDRDLAARSLVGIPIRVSRNSKYVNGMKMAIDG